jgi:hypothetical protein
MAEVSGYSDCCNAVMVNAGWCVCCDRSCRSVPYQNPHTFADALRSSPHTAARMIEQRDTAIREAERAANEGRIRELEAANRGESSRADELRRMCLELEQRAASLEAEADRKDAARVEAEQAAKAARTRCAELTAENECLTSQRAATDATTAELQQAAKRLRKERDGQRTEKERQLRKLAEAEAAAGKAIASLEAQLAAARAEAREGALREAIAAVEAINADHWASTGGIKARALMVLQSRIQFVKDDTSPPPRVDAWIPVGFAEATEPEHGAILLGLLSKPATVDAVKRVRLLRDVFTSCPKCDAEPWVNIDCPCCQVMNSLPAPPSQPAAGTEETP